MLGACGGGSRTLAGGPVGHVHGSAEVEASALVDPSASVWGLAQIRAGASIGPETIVGRGAYIGTGVQVGARVKIQNYALVYEPATVGDGAFIGPGAILTNDQHPRAITPEGALKSASDWTATGVVVREGASVGAGAICIAPVTIGAWALVGAGSVVTRDVPDYALVVGSPARQVGWVGRTGMRLAEVGTGRWTCPSTGETYQLSGSVLTQLEGAP